MGLGRIQWKWQICRVSKSLWKVWQLQGSVPDRTVRFGVISEVTSLEGSILVKREKEIKVKELH